MADWGTRQPTIQAPDVIQILGRALLDDAFRTALFNQTEQTLRDLGLDPTPNMIKFFKDLKQDNLDQAFAKVQYHYSNLGGPRNA